MTLRLSKTVVLVGMMGAGKTAVGTALAAHLGVPFVDSDAEIVAASNLGIAEIFERFGEPYFREKESQVLRRLLDGPAMILSTGGGAYLAAANRDMIAERGIAVWLRVEQSLLWARVRHKDTRPLLRTADPRRTLGELCAAREPLYAKAELVVDADPRLSVERMAMKVADALSARPDLWTERTAT